jgi:hypothetical protein
MAKKHGQWLSGIFPDLDTDEIKTLVQQLTRLKKGLNVSDLDGDKEPL